ncbi:AMP-binding protein [Acidobacteria bacterium AH-259-D05]|nr:AMP-binding protein [Acidobacteria bacterium AH-259-D05]
MLSPESCFLNKTLTDLLRENAQKEPEAPAVQWADHILSWADLDRRSDQVAAGLAKYGIGKGDVVSCQLPNIAEFLILHHAVCKRRAIFNPIHMPYRSSEVEHMLGFAGSKLLVVGPSIKDFSYVEMALEMQKRLSFLCHVVVVGEEESNGAVPFEAFHQDSAGTESRNPHPDDPFLLLFTSGTTASPKATVHTHNMRMSNSWFCGRDMELQKSDRMLCCSALSHMWGMLNYWSSVIYGCRQVLLERYRPSDFMSVAAEGEATVVIGAPVHAIDLLGSPHLKSEALSAIRLFALSGTVCSPALIRKLGATLTHCTPVVFWGMTETGGGFYTRLDDPPEVIENTAGRVSGPCVIAILDEEGKMLPSNQEGELAIKSPFGIESYLKNPKATEESFTQDGWFRTGDLAKIDSTGNVQILGRRKEIINRGGTKFAPQGVEEVILRHPGVRMAAMVGMPDERLGERGVCFVVPPPGQEPPTLEELCLLLEQDGTAKFKWPERLEIVASLPLTPTGKVQRAVLRERLRS